MNNFDDIIKKAYKKEIEEKLDYEHMINKVINNKGRKITFFNKIIIIILSLIASGTIVFATSYIIYENVWKEPQRINIIKDVTEESMVNKTDIYNSEFIDDEKNIENIAKEYLNHIEENNFSNYYIELRDNKPYSDRQYYMIRSNSEYDAGKILLIDQSTKDLLYYHNYDFEKNFLNPEIISQEVAESQGSEILKKLGIYDSNYECTNYKNDNIWTLKYTTKNENNLENIYNFYTISFGIFENSLKIMTISNNKNNYYENNPIIISNEEAIKIVKNKENEFTDSKFKVMQCDLEIKKINTFFYQLENDIVIENENIYYKIDDRERNVWVIKIVHTEKDDVSKYNSFEYLKKFGDKFYYIDATTGEIVGGSQAEIEV